MTSLIQKLWRMRGGVHPSFHKDESTHQPIQTAPIPPELVIPLQQHIGRSSIIKVVVGEKVLKGQLLAATNAVSPSAAVHAPTSGVVTAIEERLLPHPSGLSGQCIVIDTDGLDAWDESLASPTNNDYQSVANEQLLDLIEAAGIVGLGGAAFPSAVKLASVGESVIDTLIINGAECEPYISCDDQLMRERADEILIGIDILMQLLNAKRCLIGIENNKPDAIHALEVALSMQSNLKSIDKIAVASVPTMYPSGDARQLTKILTGVEIPKNVRSPSLGSICHNVATAYSIYQAVVESKPLVSRIVTVTGNGVKQPQNFEALIGTPFSFLVAQAGGYTKKAERLVMGGPMMGFALSTDDVPVVKATNCILVSSVDQLQLSDDDVTETEKIVMPCIRCGKCMDACPVSLLPQQMYWHTRAKDFEKVEEHKLSDCIECGACSYVCPSHIPLVDYFKFAKTEIRAQKLAAVKADQSRERHEFNEYRKVRDKEEREEKRRKQKEALQAKKAKESAESGAAETPAVDDKQDAIKAAMARAKAKKAARQAEKDGTAVAEPVVEDKQDLIKAAMARAQAKKAARLAETDTIKPTTDKQNAQQEDSNNAV
ncbi:electron transport complex subunit RsxC [Leucothrix arctica]|uniref:Ion-translocating oxidoreductase complex subunit C n=1 Tax=Leucothrix arctica TaxID=1481894 RepID=A0A317C4Z7_9GAMM|nr:electron transport complex subunit RsxC [Leucothrix arctica]PWQ93648.1 electron transport complex subunit RsxC [Leucothrix arctica]